MASQTGRQAYNARSYDPITSSSNRPSPPRTHSDALLGVSSTVKSYTDVVSPATWRRILGIGLLMMVVILWTTTNFLASGLLADETYPKPYFIIYINTAFFALPLIPLTILNKLKETKYWRSRNFAFYSTSEDIREREEYGNGLPKSGDSSDPEEDAPLLGSGTFAPRRRSSATLHAYPSQVLTARETARVSLHFCFTWFVANYFTAGCLEYTTVASATILTSTSSVWTLLTGAAVKVDRITPKKVLGVIASLLGIILISKIDVSGDFDKHRGTFPYKSPSQIALGDSMALLSAILYGFYTVFLKKKVGHESRVSMPLLFAFVGFFNIVLLWPGLIILHYTGVEPFELPQNKHVWTIVLLNAAASLIADLCWAYAMLLAGPLVATVGLSLTIPLSLVGQMVLDSQYSSPLYWFGALIVVMSFVLISYEGETPHDATVATNDSQENEA